MFESASITSFYCQASCVCVSPVLLAGHIAKSGHQVIVVPGERHQEELMAKRATYQISLTPYTYVLDARPYFKISGILQFVTLSTVR